MLSAHRNGNAFDAHFSTTVHSGNVRCAASNDPENLSLRSQSLQIGRLRMMLCGKRADSAVRILRSRTRRRSRRRKRKTKRGAQRSALMALMTRLRRPTSHSLNTVTSTSARSDCGMDSCRSAREPLQNSSCRRVGVVGADQRKNITATRRAE